MPKPPAPACIAETIHSYRAQFDWPGKERGHWLSRPKDIDRWKSEMAQAVWDALLDEGWIEEDNFGHTRLICRRRLGISLPIESGPFSDSLGAASREDDS